MTLPVFVPNGDSRQDTAILLVGTAKEFGVPSREIAATQGGFRISQRLSDIIYSESAEQSAPKTSGNRAAKNTQPVTDKE